LGQEGVLITFLSYGAVAPSRQSEIIKGMTDSPRALPVDFAADLERLLRQVQNPAVLQIGSTADAGR